jgi:hypothetical protein
MSPRKTNKAAAVQRAQRAHKRNQKKEAAELETRIAKLKVMLDKYNKDVDDITDHAIHLSISLAEAIMHRELNASLEAQLAAKTAEVAEKNAQIAQLQHLVRVITENVEVVLVSDSEGDAS